jgi:hypothetical protein
VALCTVCNDAGLSEDDVGSYVKNDGLYEGDVCYSIQYLWFISIGKAVTIRCLVLQKR